MRILLLGLIFLSITDAQSSVYKCKDAQGRISYSDVKCDDSDTQASTTVSIAVVPEAETQAIKDIAAKLKAASESLNANDMMSFLAKDVIFDGELNNRPVSMDYNQYQQLISIAYQMISNMKFVYRLENVEYVGNGPDITARLKLKESFTLANELHSESYTQTWWLRKSGAGYEIYRILIQP